MTPQREGYELAAWAEDAFENWRRAYGNRGCTCFQSAPCGSCTHEGNPYELQVNDDAWGPEVHG